MLLGLSKIIDCPGASVPFSASVDLRDLHYGVTNPVSEPVLASGTVRNTAGVLVMTGEITTCIHGVCDRCASAFDREIHFPINVVLVTEMANEENEDEWVFPLEGDSADLDDIVRTVFVLNLDSKQGRLQGAVPPLWQEPERRSLQLPEGARSPICCFEAAS